MKVVVFDMDGVLYRAKETMPGARWAVDTVRSMGFKVGFLTNNSARTPQQYVEILAGHGIEAKEEEIMTSSRATVKYLSRRGVKKARIFVIGESGLCDELSSAGWEVDISDEGDPCQFVVIGWDRNFSFSKIARAQIEVLVNGAFLIATNRDPAYPSAGGRVLPGAGAMVTAVETACGKKARLIGKPKTTSLKYLLNQLGYRAREGTKDVWVIGDRLDTDIVCGNTIGAHTVLVTTGISTKEQAKSSRGKLRPEYVVDSLPELVDLLATHCSSNSATRNV